VLVHTVGSNTRCMFEGSYWLTLLLQNLHALQHRAAVPPDQAEPSHPTPDLAAACVRAGAVLALVGSAKHVRNSAKLVFFRQALCR